jgi:bifunctional non-homologous end joining protein LigD
MERSTPTVSWENLLVRVNPCLFILLSTGCPVQNENHQIVLTLIRDEPKFSKAMAEVLQRNYPDLVTAKMAKAYRKKKVFINWSQNDSSKTMVCVYSLRAREKPFVSFPLTWEEIEKAAGQGDPEKLQVMHSEAVSRTEKKGDLFRDLIVKQQSLLIYDMGLKEYESKRKFEETPEPKPGLRHTENHLIFVVHKHAARALHYDLRLELDGVLKSWAVPRGPSLNPSLKRLAVMVEDHPFDYKDFEGVIPEGNYGAGSVIIWDRGFYHHPSAGDREESERLLLDGFRKGNIKFVLDGEKLQGEFALVKTAKDEKSWLLLKKKDRYAIADDILKKNRSVESNKTLEDVSEANPKKPARQKKMNQTRLREAMEREDLKDAPITPMPRGIKPMLASLSKEPFDHPDWMFEVKWDGYRAVAEILNGDVSLYSRNRISLHQKFSPIMDSLRKFRFEAILDGEIVVVDDQGHPDFQMLQYYQKSGSGHLLYYVFDLLYFQGHDLMNLPLLRRKELLKEVLPSAPNIKSSDHIWKDGVLFFHVAKEKGLEGIIAKHAQSVYRMGRRSRQWLKVKTHLTQEGVIAGFTEPRGSRKNFGALVLGVYQGDELMCIGHTGGGFSARMLREIRKKLDPLIRKKCPFKVEPKTNTPVTWVRPELVCEVVFHGWTDAGLMRQPVWLRLREDKTAGEVVRENVPATATESGA